MTATGAPVPDDPTSPWRHLPNAISVLRIVLVLPVALAILASRFHLALGLTAVAGASDALDGWLARHFNWRSRLGGVLDPLADKLLLITCFVCLARIQALPLALVVVVVGRDVIISTGAAAFRWLIGPFRPHPTRISKACTVVQILYVLLVLLDHADLLNLHLRPLAWLVAVLTVASGVDYVVRWSRHAYTRWPNRRSRKQARTRQGPHDES